MGWFFTIMPGRLASMSSATGAFGATNLVVVVVARALGVVVHHIVVECHALAGGVVGVLEPRALAVQESGQIFLVEGGLLSESMCYGDSVLRTTLMVLVLGWLGVVVVLVGVVPRRATV